MSRSARCTNAGRRASSRTSSRRSRGRRGPELVLPQRLRSLTPPRLKDDPRLRAAALGAGLIPPRTMHAPAEAALLVELAGGARRAVEIGVYEGSSAVATVDALPAGAHPPPIDPLRPPPPPPPARGPPP